ncbi:protein bric-a-brac 2 isoform X6 [Cherax quadricarinatus]|uniref:protein bric-a-brac 2 isoform X6 n=1 Tax=Cherax quadricarinatus TaxID=27406 RepID=UPI00387E3ECB
MVGRSKVWRLAKFAEGGRSEVECSLCPARIKYVGNTTNIARHLELKHPLEFAALDPTQAAAALARHEQLQQQQQQQHQREEAAICRILAQHRQELRRMKSDSGSPVTSLTLTPAQLWAWHTPVNGLPSQDIHGSGEFSHNNGEDVPVAVSPEQYLAEQSEREPTPPPPTPTPQKPESYQLRHNNHLTIVLEALARDESFMDVTLTAQGRSLKAHKSVLSAVSPYFRGVLRDNPCQHPIIIMPRDVRFEELFSIVNYIYKGEMTVAAEDLTSLLKTAEILQVSGLAPSDSSATVNPHTDCSTAGNVRSSSASSSSSSSNLASASRPSRTVKTSSHQTSTPPARPKSRDSMINPTDFMDVDMTCVKEEVQSADEEENEEQITKDSSSQPPGKLDPTFQQNLSTFSPSYDPLDHPTTSTSSVHDTSPALPVKSDPDVTADINVIAEDPHPFTCPHCQEHHREMDTLVTHLRVRHPSKASFTCGCGRVYTRQMYHQAHARVCSNTS